MDLVGADVPFFCGGYDYNNVQKAECYALWNKEYIHVTSLNHAKSQSFGNNIVIGKNSLFILDQMKAQPFF